MTRPAGRLDLLWSRPGRAERAIVWSRLALAAFALGAVWIDPAEPVRHARIAYLLLACFLIWALVVAIWGLRSAVVSSRITAIIHGVDLSFAVAINFFTGSDSPFFVLFVFLLIAATLRWHYRGTIATAIAALSAFIVLGITGPGGIGDPGFELNRFLMRCGYLIVTAGLLATLGAHLGRVQRDLGSLASAPVRPLPDPDETVSLALAHVASILGESRPALVLEDPEEPWFDLMTLDGDRLLTQRLGPEEIDPVVHGDLDGLAFLCAGPSVDGSALVQHRPGEFRRWNGCAVHPRLQRLLGGPALLVFPVVGEMSKGWVFARVGRDPDPDDLVVGVILGQQVAALIDAGRLAEQLKHSAAAAERIRLARELHDGITQVMTGTALQLASAQRLIRQQPDEAARRIDEIQSVLLDEHRKLRMFIQDLKPAALASSSSIVERIDALRQQIGMLWNLDVHAHVDCVVPAVLVEDTCRIVQECAVNAARHSGGSRVVIRIASDDDSTNIAVEDNGHGFPFEGTRFLDELMTQRLGPISVGERVNSLRGSMSIRSSRHGSGIAIVLPHTPRDEM